MTTLLQIFIFLVAARRSGRGEEQQEPRIDPAGESGGEQKLFILSPNIGGIYGVHCIYTSLGHMTNTSQPVKGNHGNQED